MVVELEEQRNELQRILNVLEQWAKDWRMEFIVEKYKIMHVGRHNQRFDYVMAGQNLTKDEYKSQTIPAVFESSDGSKPSAWSNGQNFSLQDKGSVG